MLDLWTFIMLNVLGAMSPGPDFAVVTRYGLTGSRRGALLATLGIVAALNIHVLYCVSGVAFFLKEAPQAVAGIQLVGALYLMYLGIKILRSKDEGESAVDTSKGAFYTGFFTNLFNPKATLFLLSLFGLFAESMETWGMKLAFGMSVPLVTGLWFVLLSLFLTHSSFVPFLQKKRKLFMTTMGLALSLLGVVGILNIVG